MPPWSHVVFLDRVGLLPWNDQLLLVLFVCTYFCFVLGVFLPIVCLEGRFTGEGGFSVRKSTVQSVHQFFSSGFWFPGSLVLVFSLLVPLSKFIFLSWLFAASLFDPDPQGGLEGTEGYSLWVRRGVSLLKRVAKYQLLDVFVTVLMVAFLNQSMVATRVQAGFLFYCVFSGLSMVLASLMEGRMVPPSVGGVPTPVGVGEPGLWFLWLDCGLFLFGFVYCLVSPVLAVKVTFQQAFVISEASLSMTQAVGVLFTIQAAQSYLRLPGLLLCVGGLVLPLLFVALALRSSLPRCPSFVYRALSVLSDWQAAEVLALAILVTLIGLNSFPSLLAQTPGHPWFSAFYAVLLCGFTAWDLTTVQVPKLLQARALPPLGEDGAAEAQPLLLPVEQPESQRPAEVLRQIVRHILTGPMVLTKATGWTIFLLVYLMCPTLPPETLDIINVRLQDNLPLINRALGHALPESVGACATAPPPCVEQGMLYSYQSRLYEVPGLPAQRFLQCGPITRNPPPPPPLRLSMRLSFSLYPYS